MLRDENWFNSFALPAIEAGMRALRPYQLGRDISPEKIKEDDTIVTVADRVTQKTIVTAIRAMDTETKIFAEEDRDEEDLGGHDGIIIDPCDGTNELTLGLPGSTIIIGYREDWEIRQCVIAEPISGRIWGTQNGKCFLWTYDGIGSRQPVGYRQVWKGPLDKKATVTLDVSHGFKNATSDRSIASLFARLNTKAKILMPGTNGGMQASVANGGHGMAGSITTAIGGSWDVAGVHLVLAAGGHAIAFRTAGGGFGLETLNPRRINEYSMLVCANSEENCTRLAEIVQM